MKTLNELCLGDKSHVIGFNLNNTQKRRILDLGIVPNTQIESLLKSPSGNPTAYLIRGAVIAIRNDDARGIYIH